MQEMVIIPKSELELLLHNTIAPIIQKISFFEKFILPEKIEGDAAAGKVLKKSAKAVQQMRLRGQLIENIHYIKQGRAIIYLTHSLLSLISLGD